MIEEAFEEDVLICLSMFPVMSRVQCSKVVHGINSVVEHCHAQHIASCQMVSQCFKFGILPHKWYIMFGLWCFTLSDEKVSTSHVGVLKSVVRRIHKHTLKQLQIQIHKTLSDKKCCVSVEEC